MAVLGYSKLEQGSLVTWQASGGTYTMTGMDGLANNGARMGPSHDLGARFYEAHAVWLISKLSNASVGNQKRVNLYLPTSRDNLAGSWPGRVTGSDGAYPPGSETLDDVIAQLGATMGLTMIGDTDSQQQEAFIWYPPRRYVAPVLVNRAGQSLSLTANDTQILMAPLRRLIEDVA